MECLVSPEFKGRVLLGNDFNYRHFCKWMG